MQWMILVTWSVHWRRKRVDPPFNRFQSRVFNWLTRWFVGAKLHDFSCTIKVVRRAVLEETELYGNMFRFLPVLAADRGFRVKEVPVRTLAGAWENRSLQAFRLCYAVDRYFHSVFQYAIYAQTTEVFQCYRHRLYFLRKPFHAVAVYRAVLFQHSDRKPAFSVFILTVNHSRCFSIQRRSAWRNHCVYQWAPKKRIHDRKNHLRVHEKISSQFWGLRRPAGKARKRRNIWIFRVFATQTDGMHRRTKCDVIFE